jgi:hypothetical protein
MTGVDICGWLCWQGQDRRSKARASQDNKRQGNERSGHSHLREQAGSTRWYVYVCVCEYVCVCVCVLGRNFRYVNGSMSQIAVFISWNYINIISTFPSTYHISKIEVCARLHIAEWSNQMLMFVLIRIVWPLPNILILKPWRYPLFYSKWYIFELRRVGMCSIGLNPEQYGIIIILLSFDMTRYSYRRARCAAQLWFIASSVSVCRVCISHHFVYLIVNTFCTQFWN